MTFSPGDKSINVNGHFIRGKEGMCRLIKSMMLTALSPQQTFPAFVVQAEFIATTQCINPSCIGLMGIAVSVQVMSTNRKSRLGCEEKASHILPILLEIPLCLLTQHDPISPPHSYGCILQA